MNKLSKELEELLSTFRSLRDPDTGCAWDREQTFKSIASCAIEEAYEVADAIDREDFRSLKSELGDLFFQVVFHAEMANEKGIFNLKDVINELNDKLVRRHPHVFSNEKALSSEESLTIWEDIKAQERKTQKLDSLMDDVPKNLPSLLRAKKLQKRAARVGFDWKDANKVIDKIEEELEELKIEHSKNNKDKLAEEVGDILFTIVNLTRHYDLDPEDIMRRSNLKFEQRFKAMEKYAEQNNLELKGMSVAPTFSADGRQKVLSMTENGNTDFFINTLSTGVKRRLTTNNAIDTAPSFSPDGKSIVFESDRGGGQQLYIISTQGGDAKRISFGKGRYATPVWSPRGDLIAFTKIKEGKFHIGVMRVDGTKERLLTTSFLDEGPAWAPNGRVLMFFRETPGRAGAPSIYSIDISGRNLRKIKTSSFASDPNWSPILN